MKISTRSFPKAFALVVSLTMLVLLTIIAVGLLSLSAITLRTTSQTMAQHEAQANARMALMIAIGELQESLGPDQRISARAEILDTNPGTPQVEGVAHPHYLGVWDSWDTWLTDNKGSLSIQRTYNRGRDPSLFRKWMASHPEANEYNSAISGGSSLDMVSIVAEGSAGPDTANHVDVPRVEIREGDRLTGKYAWWVSDESQKARLDLAPRISSPLVGNSIANNQILASHTGRMGIEKMDGMSDFDTTPESIVKMFTTGQARISAAATPSHFHNMTAYSVGLLTDVRFGGFKSDLSLAFESDTVPDGMDGATLFGRDSYDAPIRPMTGSISRITPQNRFIAPMSWRQLREHYRLYRSGFAESNVMQPVQYARGNPYTRRLMMGKGRNNPKDKWEERNTKGYARDLVLLRQTWIIATKSENNPQAPGGIDHYILCIPVLTIWNPYNITLRIDSGELSALGSLYWAVSMQQRSYRGNELLKDVSFPDSNLENVQNNSANHNIVANQLGYRMLPTTGTSGNAIDFQPGEVRVFSTDAEVLHGVGSLESGMNSRHFFASPGYTPVQDSGPNVLRGLKYLVDPGPASSARGALTFSLRMAPATQQNDNFWFGASQKGAHLWRMHEVFAADHGAVYEDGSVVNKQAAGEWQDVAYLGASSIDWIEDGEISDAWIVRDDAANRARWPAPGSPPTPVGIFSIVAKSAEPLDFESSADFAADFRNRTWLHAPPTRLANFLINPEDLNRADSPYQVHFRPVNSDQEVSLYLQANGPLGYFGGGYTAAQGQSHVTALSIPTAPATNLGSLAGVRIDHGRARFPSDERYNNIKHLAHAGGAFGAGIGNAYAHPMIGADSVYTRNNFGSDTGWSGTRASNLNVTDDYWDHLFLANEELWDSWFFSGIAPAVNNGVVTKPKREVALDFFSGQPTHISPHFQPHLNGKTPQDLAALVATTTAATGENGWDKIAPHILNRGQFNVNSTSKEAWKALFMSLADRPIATYQPGSPPRVEPHDESQVSLSRHTLANSASAAIGPGDDNAWRGIRKLSEAEIDKLAEETVRQVKLRGPFLNMTEFINRRLSDDKLGVTGALQAAIDWDEFNAGYNGTTSGSGESINAAYKTSDAMITNPPANYPNGNAARGSRYAGIPGYVMQSDILQGISSSLSVRGDTFLVRAYGESLAPDGSVAARAWCEAVVQRMPQFTNPSDGFDEKLRDPTRPVSNISSLHSDNQNYGRQFNIISFRWLNSNEV